jgi:hypothetical protein
MLHTCHGGLMRMSLLCFVFSVSVISSISSTCVPQVYPRCAARTTHYTCVPHTHTHVTSMWPHLPYTYIFILHLIFVHFLKHLCIHHMYRTQRVLYHTVHTYICSSCTPLVHAHYHHHHHHHFLTHRRKQSAL